MPIITEDGEFETMEDMWEHHKSNQRWYEKVWGTIYYPIYRFCVHTIWERIKPSNFKHWYQRARYGYSYRDVWSIDWFLADIIPKMVKDLKKTHHGIPGSIVDKWANTEEGEKAADLEWKLILDKIAHGFELQYEIINHILFDCQSEEEEKTMRELMVDKESFDGCRIMTPKEKTELNDGWDLFREHFLSLWD